MNVDRVEEAPIIIQMGLPHLDGFDKRRTVIKGKGCAFQQKDVLF